MGNLPKVIHNSITFGVNLSTIYIAFKYFVCWELGVVGNVELIKIIRLIGII